ncbi:NAD(P)H-hydrate dehydratase [Xylophilus sp. ASV27]|uniref:NAD(P)H-hydrate dehydratase n=1 Tax=Xylophilus sp. ASV27 TaxID=2795129 RepID=UPI0018EAA288|nr:NAD(P)H-hydrate dehydratase [Xylophilus sp. ASV27]
MDRITPAQPHALHDTAATRQIERRLQQSLPPCTLMQRAGHASARLAQALAPHARSIWIACGPGHNGGDGLEAAALLQQAGRPAWVTLLAEPARLPPDARHALQRAQDAGVRFGPPPAAGALSAQDLAIDAVLGIGAAPGRADAWLQQAIAALAACGAPVLALDLPSGLDADTGTFNSKLIAESPGTIWARGLFHAKNTLSLLTLKPGLFTAQGRDMAGAVWFDDLGSGAQRHPPTAWLAGAAGPERRLHASHKGSYGDVAVIGGEGLARAGRGMSGAALLAATAALHAGAGRVLLALLEGNAGFGIDPAQPELMLRSTEALDLRSGAVVCGCGGGDAVRGVLPRVLGEASRLVLDADALNAIAADAQLRRQLARRAAAGQPTVLTPHPLEAARLLGQTAAEVQADRLAAARRLAEDCGCTVVLKGSGSIVAAPRQAPSINPTGNARLATAGTGDVLAGMVGAGLARGADAFSAAVAAVYRHGALADQWPPGAPLTASALARR